MRGVVQKLSFIFLLFVSVITNGETNESITVGEAALNGDLLAQCGLAEMADMFGNYEAAVKWWEMAAEQGDPVAQYQLGVHYAGGLGVSTDVNRALELWAESGSKENVDAQMAIAIFYDDKTQPLHDAEKALKWFARAAEQGNAEAQYSLGAIYAFGDGVSQDYATAKKWYYLAVEQGYASAQYNLGVMYANGEGIAADAAQATRLYRLAADQGHVAAQLNLGVMYWTGRGVIEDYVEAYAWLALSAMNGNEKAVKNKEVLGRKISNSQVATGQQRAKELQVLIERKKTIVESDSKKPLSSDISPSGFGSGLLVKGGYILTCWHVVDGAERISISLNGKDHVVRIIQKDAANDIAILKVNDVDGGIALNLSDEVKLGEKVFTLGYPHPDLQGSDIKFTTGSISSLTGLENSPRYFQISVPVQSGNSGGPLFDEHGNLIGIVAAKLDSLTTVALTGDLPQNVNYAIKVDYLVPLLKSIDGVEIQPSNTKDVNLLELIDELKKSVVMIKVY